MMIDVVYPLLVVLGIAAGYAIRYALTSKESCGNPLCLPEGTVRAVTMWMLVGSLIYLAAYTLDSNIIAGLIAMAGAVVNQYFNIRGKGGESEPQPPKA